MKLLKVGFFCCLLGLLNGCGDGISSQAETSKREVDSSKAELPAVPEKPVIAAPKYPRLDNDNVLEYLSEYGKIHPENKVKIITSMGDIVVELFEETPIHRANFLYLIERDYYNPTEIVRVIKNFVVQGGNSQEVEPAQKRFLIGEYTLPAEFCPRGIHLRGALAMSRSYEGNPDKRSSAYDFYIVDGRKISVGEIYDAKKLRSYSDDQLQSYQEQGGAIHLDQEHTVFGRVIKGMDVVEEISEVDVDESNWPRKYIEVRMEILKN
jgi:peptidyl-prolyl cis-trans isomerase A (cyclophilin A)